MKIKSGKEQMTTTGGRGDVAVRRVTPVRHPPGAGMGVWVFDDRDPLDEDTHALMPWSYYEALMRADEAAGHNMDEIERLKDLVLKFVEATDHIGSGIYDWERVLEELRSRALGGE